MKIISATSLSKTPTKQFQFGTSLSIFALATVLSGCTRDVALPFTAAPDIRIANNWQAYQRSSPRMVDNGWVADFNSPALTKLVDEAIANNHDLRAAYYRVVEARALDRQVSGGSTPSLDLGVGAGRSGLLDRSAAQTNIFVDVQLSWEADLWGKIGNQQAASHMDVLSEEAIFEAVRQSIAGQVADAWIVIAGNQEKIKIVGREIASRQRTLRNIEQQVSAQSLSVVDANLVRANLEKSKAQQALLEGQLESSVRVLEVLLGRYPDDQLAGPSGIPGLPRAVPAGLPSQLLERRPDLVARERAVAAAYHRTRAAEAARLPRLALSGNITGGGGSIADALDPATIVWGLVGNVLVPLLDGDRREQEVNVRTARQAAALAEYGAAALRAFQEVEDALGADEVLRHRVTHLQSAANQLEAVVEAQKERFELGETDLTRVEDARVQYYDVLQLVAEVKVLRLRNRVALYRALGGSFNAAPPVEAASSG